MTVHETERTAQADLDGRFQLQRIDERTWLEATAANLAADHANGYAEVVDGFLEGRPEWQSFRSMLASSTQAEVAEYVQRTRGHSLAFLTLMLTGVCNADCPICFTDRRKKPQELTSAERNIVLRDAAALGAKYVYVPGEGEPTMDPGWWDFLEACREYDLPAIVFTNAMIFGDDELARRRWGMTGREAARRLADYPVHLYAKYWSESQELSAKLLAVPRAKLPFDEYLGRRMPIGVKTLLEELPEGRAGFEVVVERRNADEVSQVIAPFAAENGIPRIVEMLQHNGRTFGNPAYDATPQQAHSCEQWLSPTSCRLASCKAVVTVQGYVSPRIAILEHQLPEDRRNVRDASLDEIIHGSDYIVSKRYNLSCLCESVPLELAQASQTVLTPVTNVDAPGLSSTITRDEPPPHPEPAAAGCGGGCTGCSSVCGLSSTTTTT